MKTSEKRINLIPSKRNHIKTLFSMLILATIFTFGANNAYAHCDSYDGPVIKDAIKALETNNVNLVMKWISKEQENEINSLFNKTYSLRNGDKEIYKIVENYFFKTLVRLHRETEGAPYTGLKAAGTTKKIVKLSDNAIETKNFNAIIDPLTNHLSKVLKEKYEKVVTLEKVKNESKEKGREYVKAYVDYTHTIEAIHDIIMRDGAHSAHNH